jgi:hypothetical protein
MDFWEFVREASRTLAAPFGAPALVGETVGDELARLEIREKRVEAAVRNDEGEREGPFVSGSTFTTSQGVPVGVVTRTGIEGTGEDGRGHGPLFDLRTGVWHDAEEGNTAGFRHDLSLAAGASVPPGEDRPGLDVEMLSVSNEATVSESTLAVGAQIDLMSFAMTVDQPEVSGQSGVEIGMGLEGRLHYGDRDDDGVRELGAGADVGFGTFDLRSELFGEIHDAVEDGMRDVFGDGGAPDQFSKDSAALGDYEPAHQSVSATPASDSASEMPAESSGSVEPLSVGDSVNDTGFAPPEDDAFCAPDDFPSGGSAPELLDAPEPASSGGSFSAPEPTMSVDTSPPPSSSGSDGGGGSGESYSSGY